MGTAYRAFLLPRQRAFRPDATQLLELIERLEQGRWLPSATGPWYPFDEIYEEDEGPAFAAFNHVHRRETAVPYPVTQEWLGSAPEGESVLIWRIEDYDRTDLIYPFTKRPEAPFCELLFHRAIDYVFDADQTTFQGAPTGSWLSRLLRRPEWNGTVRCSCGEDLAYQISEWIYGTKGRLRTVCPRCRAPFDPSGLQATVRNPYGHQEPLLGGLTYRFALILDCDKALPSRNDDFAVQRSLLSLLESTLGQEIVVVPEYY